MSRQATLAIEEAFTEEWGRIVAALIRRTGDWDLAEDCAQQAFAEAARRWPGEGVPRQPGAWLMTVARNRAIDRLRHERMRDARLREAAALIDDRSEDEGEEEPGDDSGIEDDRLRLIFTCCHPAHRARGPGRADAPCASRLDDHGDRERVPRARADDGQTTGPRQAQDRARRDPVSSSARASAARAHQRCARGALPDVQRGIRRVNRG